MMPQASSQMPHRGERLEERIRARIREQGPMPFREFMALALYDSEQGYYRQDRFGRSGDFYTAGQLQPVFGRWMARHVARVRERIGRAGFRVVELGAGREELRPFLEPFGYEAVEIDRGALPSAMRGVIIANEFFDALPVDLAAKIGGAFRELRVSEQLALVPGERVRGGVAAYLDRYWIAAPDGSRVEVNLAMLEWARRLAACLEEGELLAIDYGFTAAERPGYWHGTLMSYRKHAASAEILRDAGERDITAHVDFGALADALAAAGFAEVRVERFGGLLVEVAEAGGLEELLAAADEGGRQRLRGQWKTLLVSFGERFRALRAWRRPRSGDAGK
jgi:SAM-dependent MidA family methyltransferase